jgi:hypothetical protein
MNITNLVSQLLRKYDCVVIPEFGGFITKYCDAGIDLGNLEIYPTARIVAFNKELVCKDNLLQNYISKINDISDEQALENIQRFVSDFNNKLKEGKTIRFADLGDFCHKSNQLVFTPNPDLNLLNSSYGLQKFSYPVLKTNSEVLIKKKQFIKSESVKKSKGKRLIYISSAAAVIGGLMFLAFKTGMFENRPDLQIAGFNPVYVIETATSGVPEEIKIKETISISEINFVGEEITEETLVIKSIPKTESVISEPVSDFRNHIIAGSFSSKRNAENLQKDLLQNGYNSQIFAAPNGMYRVSVKSYLDQNSAVQELNAMRLELGNKELWVCNI